LSAVAAWALNMWVFLMVTKPEVTVAAAL
jgi:hypothetical protein